MVQRLASSPRSETSTCAPWIDPAPPAQMPMLCRRCSGWHHESTTEGVVTSEGHMLGIARVLEQLIWQMPHHCTAFSLEFSLILSVVLPKSAVMSNLPQLFMRSLGDRALCAAMSVTYFAKTPCSYNSMHLITTSPPMLINIIIGGSRKRKVDDANTSSMPRCLKKQMCCCQIVDTSQCTGAPSGEWHNKAGCAVPFVAPLTQHSMRCAVRRRYDQPYKDAWHASMHEGLCGYVVETCFSQLR